MPFFTYPANADWLLPLVKIPLSFVSLVLSAIHAMGPYGNIACIAIIMALYARNIMSPARR